MTEAWAREVSAITLFAEDLEAVKGFFERTMGLPVHFEDPHSVVYRLGSLLVNYLVTSEADGLIGPAVVGGPGEGVRVQLTIPVDDVAEVASRIEASGGELLRGPEVRPWGPTTATFRDPAGHVWELASSTT